jgi:hypothetical protein
MLLLALQLLLLLLLNPERCWSCVGLQRHFYAGHECLQRKWGMEPCQRVQGKEPCRILGKVP